MGEVFNSIKSICRLALSSPSKEMIEYQVERLIEAYKKNGNDLEAQSIQQILDRSRSTVPFTPLNITLSSLGGEELTKDVPIPVDKESSSPILEVVLKEDLENIEPLYNKSIQHAVDSVIEEWQNYDKLLEGSATPSRSCLLFGDPGTGKTMLAKWIAKQVGLPVVVARLDGIVSSYLGTSARNLANLFKFANRYKCILLLDEFDSIAKLRDDPQEVGEVKRIVNALLQNLDERATKGFTIGVTNHESLLDPAVWRRFDIQMMIPRPDADVRRKLFEYYSSPIQFSDAEKSFIVWCLEDSTGADIRKFADWVKRKSILDKEMGQSIISMMRRYSTLNATRLNPSISALLAKSDEDLCSYLVENSTLGVKKKDIAELFSISPSVLSKRISKAAKNESE